MAKRVNYNFEYVFKAKAELLYNYISTPYNLAAWFADDAQINGGVFTFTWEGSGERAKITKQIIKKKIVLKWIDRKGDEFLSFDIESDDVTGGTVLLISDFDDEDQVDEARLMWDSAIQKLKNIIGG